MPPLPCRSSPDLRLGLFLAAAAACTSESAHGAAFQLLEQSGSGVGYAFAGAAASADDASAMYFNPASLAYLDSAQIVLAIHGIDLETEFEDRGSVLPPAGLGALPAGSTRDDAGDLSPVPNGYFAWPVDERLAFGIGVNGPFGLETEYVDPWIGRFQGISSELITVNVNPALAWRLSDAVTIGVGVNYQYAEAELSSAVLLGPGVEGRAVIDVDDEEWGWNVGAIFELPTATRIGVSYRSKLEYTLTGETRVTTLAGTPVDPASGPTSADITFPDFAHLSVVHPAGAVELRADVMWTNWSEVGTIVALDPATGLPRDVLEFEFDDSVRVALGAGYEWNERWTFRGGVAWDETPVKNERTRTVRLPDEERWWLALGARWRPTEAIAVDFGYVRIFTDDAGIEHTRGQLGGPPAFASTVAGVYDSTVGIYSAQLTWSFLE